MKFEKRRKLKMSLEQAMALAAGYIAKLDLRGWQCEVVGGRRLEFDPDYWIIDLAWSKPGCGQFDDPGFVVNGRTGNVRSWDEYFRDEILSGHRE